MHFLYQLVSIGVSKIKLWCQFGCTEKSGVIFEKSA